MVSHFSSIVLCTEGHDSRVVISLVIVVKPKNRQAVNHPSITVSCDGILA